MNIELWKFVFQIIQAVATAGVGIYVWWSNREKVTTTKFSGHDKRLTTLESTLAKLAEADNKAGQALDSITRHKETVSKELEAVRLEVNKKSTCANHQRMETDNEKQFVSLDKMHASIRGISEKINGVANNVDLLLKHHISGGN